VPLHLVRELQHLLLELHGPQEPLRYLQELYGSVAAPAPADVLLHILLLDHQPGGLEVLYDRLLGLLN